VSRVVVALVLCVIGLAGAVSGSAFAVRGGKRVTIRVAPWTVAVLESGRFECSGVIIDPSHVLTAGHCLFGPYGDPIPASDITIEAGVSNFMDPLASDARQTRSVSIAEAMPGYQPPFGEGEPLGAVSRDLGVLTLSSALDLGGPVARAAALPRSGAAPPAGNGSVLLSAGFGSEASCGCLADGALNEDVTPSISDSCTNGHVLCTYTAVSGTCGGDSGSGLIEPGPRPIVVGVLDTGNDGCIPGYSNYIYLGSAAVLRFIRSERNLLSQPAFKA
jgi:hypothetical protein